MLRLRWLICLLGLVPLLVPSARGEEFPTPLAKLELSDGDALVFLGDSITHQALYTQYVEDYFYTRFPKMRLRFHNAGVGGAQAWDALQRLDKDVTAYKPKYVTILLGMNDGRYQPFDAGIFGTYQTDMKELIARIHKTGAMPILMTPSMYDSRAARIKDATRKTQSPEDRLEQYNAVLAYFGSWLREQALRGGLGFVDLYGPLNTVTMEQRETDPQFTLIPDAVHPGPSGQLVMAAAMVEQLDLPRPVSSIRIVRAPSGRPISRATGGKLTDLEVSEEGLSFTFLADSLPWAVPEEAQQGADLVKLGHRLSREALEIHELPAGVYELRIDDQPVGMYSAIELERHVELQGNAKTPQYQQALKVAELNRERNAGPIKGIRGAWSQFQGYARTKAQAEAAPNDQKLAAQLAAAAKKIEDLDERVRTHEAEAKRIEDDIYRLNQPQPRKYVLRRQPSAKLTGTVVRDGQPVAKAKLKFTSAAGPIATATTDDAGNYIARSSDLPGVIPGTYTVTITGPGIDKKYANADTSGLVVEVTPEENQFAFELK